MQDDCVCECGAHDTSLKAAVKTAKCCFYENKMCRYIFFIQGSDLKVMFYTFCKHNLYQLSSKEKES